MFASFKHYLLLCMALRIKSETDLKTLKNTEGIHTNCAQNGEVAVTFDDGPAQRTEAVLDVLKKYKVKATFFVNGQNYEDINDEITQAKIRRIQNEGHQIGSHTWSHLDLTDGVSEEEIRKQMEDLDDKLLDILGFRPTIMRPPYGEINDTVRDILYNKLGYDIIMWNIETYDWKYRDVNKSMEAYYEAMGGASSRNSSFITNHHDTLPGGSILAEMAINYINERGFSPVVIDKCISNASST